MRNLSKGFTLFELATTLGIVGVLVGVAAPGFHRLRSDWLLTSHAEALLVALHHARSDAISRGQAISLCLRAASGGCVRTTAEAGNGWLVYADGATMLQQQVLPQGLRLTGNRTAVTFWATPRAGTTATLLLCDDSAQSPPRAIIVSQTGRPRMSRVAADGGALSCTT